MPLCEASDRLCGKRLQGLLPLLVESLKSHDRPFGGFDPQAKRRQRLAQPALGLHRRAAAGAGAGGETAGAGADGFAAGVAACGAPRLAICAWALSSQVSCSWVMSPLSSAVLRNSLASPGPRAHLRPWKLRSKHAPVCFFRDDALSDRIGFTYSTWPAEAAVADFVQHLEAAQAHVQPGERGVLPIIMDGENAWEYYAENGQALKRRVQRSWLRITT